MNTVQGSMRKQQQQTQQMTVAMAQMLDTLKKDKTNLLKNLCKGKKRRLFQYSNILLTKLAQHVKNIIKCFYFE